MAPAMNNPRNIILPSFGGHNKVVSSHAAGVPGAVFQAPIGLTKAALLKRRSLLSCIFTKKKRSKLEELKLTAGSFPPLSFEMMGGGFQGGHCSGI